jgi:hypothetical protein|tara:strand:- start:896 stop:1186 length:291 start_codon:yes stop_codon:yes gene_type:complete
VDHQTSQVTGRPYSEKKEDGYLIREFSQDTPSFEFVWHRDKEDRYVQAIHDNDWSFQLDNDIPRELLKDKLFIPKETYHRLIKGTGDLVVKIWQED